MRFEPHELSEGLTRMLEKAGRHDLIGSGFDVHDDVLASSAKVCKSSDHAVYHALFDRSATHYAAIAPKVEAPEVQQESEQAAPVTPPAIVFPDPPSQAVHWIKAAILLLILLTLLAGKAHCQGNPNGGPTSPLIVRGSNGASVLVTRSGGLLNFKCDGTTVICSWSAALNTFTITSAGGGSSGGSFSFSAGNGVDVIPTGDIGIYPTARAGAISRIDISGHGATNASTCSITVDIWKAAGAIPTVANKISASAPLTLSSALLAQNGSISGWTTAVSLGDVFAASIASVTGCTSITGQVWY